MPAWVSYIIGYQILGLQPLQRKTTREMHSVCSKGQEELINQVFIDSFLAAA